MDESGRGRTGLWSRLGARRSPDSPATAGDLAGGVIADAPAFPTKALRKFLTSLEVREVPVLLDLGPVIGSNLNFFGETLGCKVFIEDLYADVEHHTRADTIAELPAFFARRFAQREGTIDGILAWDLFDYLEPPAAQALASQLVRLMRVDATLLGFFSTAQPRTVPHYTKFIIVDESTLRHREYPGSRLRQRVLQNRDIIRLFEHLRVSDSFLLQTNRREILFRKPSYLTGRAG